MLHALIMAGGGGTRFWPRSRQRRPKQFLAMSGERTLIQLAQDRLEALVEPKHTWVITAEAYRAETAQQLKGIPADQIIGEPVGRNTAPCIGLGAALIARQDPDAVMLVSPADHVIEPRPEFRRTVLAAQCMTQTHPAALITFGIQPTFAATGYGYIQRGPLLKSTDGISVFRVKSFEEKPPQEKAERFFASGEYYWNSGIFVWKAATLLSALATHCPDLFAALQRIAAAWDSPNRSTVLSKEYQAIKGDSIDYAVMEKVAEVLVVQAPYRWDDVGSWLALERMNPQDADGNTVLAQHVGVNTTNCLVVGDEGKLIATVGVANLIIIQDGDVTFVADRREEETIRQLVALLKQKRLEKYL
jgi:mannose-1-phosphate guanylyltransferase